MVNINGLSVAGSFFSKVVGRVDWSQLARGVAPSSNAPQDRSSAALINAILGRSLELEAWALLEFFMWPPKVEVTQSGWVAFGGGEVDAKINGLRMEDWCSHRVEVGDSIEIKLNGAGSRVYLGFSEQRPPEFEGRLAWFTVRKILPTLTAVRVLKGRDFVKGKHDDLFTRSGIDGDEIVVNWRASRNLNDMGVKLFSGMQNGERYEKDSFQRLSSPTQDGVLQLTPDGLIALLRSRGTIGGYPQVGQILDADVDKLAQLKPGSGVKFRLIELEEAERIQSIYEEFLKQIVKA